MDACLPERVAAAIGRYREALEARFGSRLREVLLFGSYARGEAGSESDVDLLVLVDELTWRESIEAINMGTDEEYSSGVLISPIPKATAEFAQTVRMETPFAGRVLREGRSV